MKRKGFTLIELMVVIAIIIILAAIAIPNYLKMTERAKRSRLASDMATLATGLETFKTDWGIYPIASSGQDVSSTSTRIYQELGGVETTGNTNIAANMNAVGENGPIQYLKPGTLTSIKNPFNAATWPVTYISTGTGTSGWVLFAQVDTGSFLYRTSSMSQVATSTTSSISVPAN